MMENKTNPKESKSDLLIHSLMSDVVGDDISLPKDDVVETISNIMHSYNLSTDMDFVQKMATMKITNNGRDESIDLDSLPNELQEAAFLPVNTIADIALKQDIDLIISQIPEWYTALQVTRDSICESDIVTGRLSRDISFPHKELSKEENSNIMSKIEMTEEKLGLDSIIKNHLVMNTCEYGEGPIYVIPYAQVFEDLYRYKMNKGDKNNQVSGMFNTSSISTGYGYSEAAIEVSLSDTIIQESAVDEKKNNTNSIFTEAEVMELFPNYHNKNPQSTDKKKDTKQDELIDRQLEMISKNIRYVNNDIALPVIEESAHDLYAVYDEKYREENNYVQEVKTVFEQVMDDNGDISDKFKNIKGVYLRTLPPTKLIPIRIDRTIIGYYYISDMTRPEEAGDRKNSGLSGYTLRSPSVGFDSFSPDKMFCEKLASKIINNFDMKFMRDNTSLHQQIVAILQAHKFDESMLRFVYIPAEHVVTCSINKDGMGKGHSMLEPGLITARMYMFLKMYSILYQVNNSQVRVYNLRMSGIDKNYKQFVSETMRKFSARRITANDIFNYRSSMTKVSGGSEMVMPLGASDTPPITFDKIDASESPINNELLESLKNESINSTPVPSIMVRSGGESQIEFSKENELSDTRFNTFISSTKIELNPDVTKLYRVVLRWETDIDPDLLKYLRFAFKLPKAKELNVTVEMINNFEALSNTITKIFLTKDELKDGSGGEGEPSSDVVREYKKLLLKKSIPQLDIIEFEDLADQARNNANKLLLDKTRKNQNLVDDEVQEEGEMM